MSAASGQNTAPRGPAGGLFGKARPEVAAAEKLNFTFNLAQSIDSDLPPELGGGGANGASQTGGFSTLFTGEADYSHTTRRWKLAGGASTAFKYYQPLGQAEPLSHGAGLGISIALPKRGRVNLTQQATYSPAYLYELLPQANEPEFGAPIATNPDYRIAQQDSYTYLTRLALKFGSPATTEFTTSGEYRSTAYVNEKSAPPNLDTRAAGVMVSHSLSRAASFSFGYVYRTGDFGFSEPSEEQQVSAGLTYSPPLSRTRRLILHVNATPSWLRLPPSDVTDASEASAADTLYRMQADASITYPFRPNWRATLTYHRGIEYLAGVTEPLLSDGVRTEITGLVTRPVDVAASVGYVTSTSPSVDVVAKIVYYTGTVRIRYALKRSVALYSEYLYYFYDQRGQRSLAPELPAVYDQRAVRFGCTLFIEAFGR